MTVGARTTAPAVVLPGRRFGRALPGVGLAVVAMMALGACDLGVPVAPASPSVELSFPSASAPPDIPGPSPVRPPQSPPSGAPAPD